jgi:hypothetical protein
VKKGEGTAVFHVPCLPAGGISGPIDLSQVIDHPGINVINSNSSPRVWLDVVSDEGAVMPGGDKQNHFESTANQVVGNPPHYFVSALPLGGTYRVRAQWDGRFADSVPVHLDETHPWAEAPVVFQKGTTVTAQVLWPDGSPCRSAEVSLVYAETRYSHRMGVKKTNEGRFEIPGVNFAAHGRYVLAVKAGRGLMPKVLELQESAKEVTVKLEPGLPLDVEFVDEQDHPLRGVQASAFAVTTDDQPPLRYLDSIDADGPTDDQGHLHFSCFPQGQFQIRVTRDLDLMTPKEGADLLDSPIVDLPRGSKQPLRLRVKKVQK